MSQISRLDQGLEEYLVQIMPFQTLMALSLTSARWRELSLPLLPRHYIMARMLQDRDRLSTRLHRPPRLIHQHEPTRSHLVDGSQSQLTIDLDASSTHDVGPEMAAAARYLEGCKPLHTLTILGNHDRIQLVLFQLQPPLSSSLQTLILVREYAEVSAMKLLQLGPLILYHSIPTLTNLKMRRTLLDPTLLPILCPNLRSLHAADFTTNWTTDNVWEHLTGLRNLQDLSMTSRIGYLDQHVLDIVPLLVGLTRLSLMGTNTGSMYAAVADLTSLQHLILRRALTAAFSTFSGDIMWMDLGCQDLLNQTAENNPTLQLLDLDAHPYLVIPTQFTSLVKLTISHTTAVPPLASLRHLMLRRMQTYHTYPPLSDLPSGITSLHTPYDELSAALRCRDLRDLTWRPHAEGDFPDDHQETFMAHVRQDVAWPALRRVASLPEREHGRWAFTEVAHPGLRMHCKHSAELLTELASREDCGIERVILFQRSSHDFNAIRALIIMPSLTSVTLVRMKMSVTQLRQLAQKPSMQVIELIGITRLTKRQFQSVRAEITGLLPLLLWREMSCIASSVINEDEVDSMLSYPLW